MKLWIYISCPKCGFAGCAAPVDLAPCPKCGHRADPEPTPERGSNAR